jgi:hypothetical protein
MKSVGSAADNANRAASLGANEIASVNGPPSIRKTLPDWQQASSLLIVAYE